MFALKALQITRHAVLVASVLLSSIAGSVAARGAEPAAVSPVVVELFTSQGCSSCPPADALLAELTGRPDVVALSFHVDYWDYIGWKDPYASPQYTARQQRYTQALNLRYVYTPQIVVDGRADVVGSHRAEVLAAIETAAQRDRPIDITFVTNNGGKVIIPQGHAPASSVSALGPGGVSKSRSICPAPGRAGATAARSSCSGAAPARSWPPPP